MALKRRIAILLCSSVGLPCSVIATTYNLPPNPSPATMITLNAGDIFNLNRGSYSATSNSNPAQGTLNIGTISGTAPVINVGTATNSQSAVLNSNTAQSGNNIAVPINFIGTGGNITLTVNALGAINYLGSRTFNATINAQGAATPPISPTAVAPANATGTFSIYGYASSNIDTGTGASVAATVNTNSTGAVLGKIWITGPLTLTTTGSGVKSPNLSSNDTTNFYSIGGSVVAGNGSQITVGGNGGICSFRSVTGTALQVGSNSTLVFNNSGGTPIGGIYMGASSTLTMGISGNTSTTLNASVYNFLQSNNAGNQAVYYGLTMETGCTTTLYSRNIIYGGVLGNTSTRININGLSQIQNLSGSSFSDINIADNSTLNMNDSGYFVCNVKARSGFTLNNFTYNSNTTAVSLGNITAGNNFVATFSKQGGLNGSISAGSSSSITMNNSAGIYNGVTLGTDSQITLNNSAYISGTISIGSSTGAAGKTASSITSNTSNNLGTISAGNSVTVTMTSTGGANSVSMGTGASLNMTSSSSGSVLNNVSVGANSTVLVNGTGNINGTLTLGNNSSVTMGTAIGQVFSTTYGIGDVITNGTVRGAVTYGTGCTLNIMGGRYVVTPSNQLNNNPIVNIGSNGQITTEYYDVLNTTSTMTIAGYLWCDWGVTRGGPSIITGTVNTDQPQDWFIINTGSGTSSMTSGQIIGQGSFQNYATFNFSGGNINVSSTVQNQASGIFNYSGGTIYSSLQNSGSFHVAGGTFQPINYFANSGSLVVDAAGTLQVSGFLYGTGSVTNNGTINIPSGLSLGTTGAFANNAGGNVNIYGSSFSTTSFSSFTNAGNIFLARGLQNGVIQNVTIANSIVSTGASSITLGKDSLGAYYPTNWTTSNGTVYTFASVNVYNNSTLTTTVAFSNINTALNIGDATNPGYVVVGAAFSGSGNLNITNGSLTINGVGFSMSGTTGAIASNGSIYLNGGGTLTLSPLMTNHGKTYVSGTTSNIVGSLPGGSGSALTLGYTSPTTFTVNGAYSNVQSITLQTSGTTLSSAFAITGVDGTFTTNSGTSASFTNALSSTGTGTITDYGTMSFSGASSALSGFASVNIPWNNSYLTFSNTAISNIPVIYNNGVITFNAGASPSTLSNVGTINAYTGSQLLFNDSINLNTTNIVGATGSSNTSMNIASGKTVQTNGAITNLKTITINPTATLQLNTGATMNAINSCIVNGTLFIASGAQFTLNNGVNLTGSGTLSNSGDLFVNSSNLVFPGSFVNNVSGVFSVGGQPTLQFSGSFTNRGLIVVTFSNANTLPQFVLGSTLDLTNGTFAIGYNNNFIASGNYPFISSTGGPLSLSSIGAADLPLPNLYIKSWSLNAQGGTINVLVERTGFGNVATDPAAKQIGNYWETIGASNPSATQLSVLNALEATTSVAELNAALLELMPTENVPLQTLDLTSNVLRKVQGRIKQTRMPNAALYASGDVIKDHGAWIRFNTGSAIQSEKDTLPGYKATYNGTVGGMDRDLSPWIKVGAAASIYHSNVDSTANSATTTRINSYQAMVYGSFSNMYSEYLDWIINGGINNYHGLRGISIGTFNAVAVSHYTGQQLSLKAIASKEFIWNKYYQLTPLASAQYSFLRQLGYTEDGAGDLNQTVQPNNISLLELGVGIQLSAPFDQGKMTSIPEIHGMLLVDAKGGAVQTTSQFITGGPLLTNTIQASRIIAQIGGSLTFKFTDSIEAIANYDFEWRHKYKAHDFYFNLRYIF